MSGEEGAPENIAESRRKGHSKEEKMEPNQQVKNTLKLSLT